MNSLLCSFVPVDEDGEIVNDDTLQASVCVVQRLQYSGRRARPGNRLLLQCSSV